MEKFKFLDGGDYFINLYSNNNFIGSRKVYHHCGKYYVKYNGRYGEILDFYFLGIPSVSVEVDELYFR